MRLTSTTVVIKALDGEVAIHFRPGLSAERYAMLKDLADYRSLSRDQLRHLFTSVALTWGVKCHVEMDLNEVTRSLRAS